MKEYKFIYGPVPSRRLGLSLGISPIPKKTCSYSCIYCQLGRTDKMTNNRKDYYPINDILYEVESYLVKDINYDVITIVGEGEPTLYSSLFELIISLKNISDKPIAVITNGSLLYNKDVEKALMSADIVLPSLDAFDELSFGKINRPHKDLDYTEIIKGIIEFSHNYKGQLWLEIMLIKGFNDDINSLYKFKDLISQIKYNRLYINTPIRPPAELYAKASNNETIHKAIDNLGGISIENLVSNGFASQIKDNYKAIESIIKRHPMNQYEIRTFLHSRECNNIQELFNRLQKDEKIEIINYKGYKTYRLK